MIYEDGMQTKLICSFAEFNKPLQKDTKNQKSRFGEWTLIPVLKNQIVELSMHRYQNWLSTLPDKLSCTS
jgi:hypothetical protein